MPKVTRIESKKPILTPRKKVAAYARVSKDTEKLMHSLSAQISYYSNLIQRTSDWEYAGVYVDAGLTGTNTQARPEFQRLVADCEAGKIDIVLTKSISRFARNTVDLLATVRRLKELGVEVRFEKEHINSLSSDGEVMLSILASFAQEESTSLSRNIKWVVQKKYKEGRVHSHQKMLGYKWEDEEMVIIPEEAETVRYIFNSYIQGKSVGEITKELNSQGLKSVRGKNFSEGSIVKILHNEQYTGCLILQQSYNYGPKKQKLNYGEMPMYRVDDHHPAIISEETFSAAVAMREKRSKEAQRDPGFRSEFSGKVWCGKCGRKASWHRSPQARKRGDMSSVIWVCVGRNMQSGCDCKNIQDRDIVAAVSKLGLTADKVQRIDMFDDKLKIQMKNGRTEVWHRT